jgi:hypothetical protein|tara:strand:+ start:958 stop:1341 length:384 start_codon:yes stop_codon:yes gene_type:complete
MEDSPITVMDAFTNDIITSSDVFEEGRNDDVNYDTLNDLSKMRYKLNLLESMIYNDSFYLKKSVDDDVPKNNPTDDEEIMIDKIKKRIDQLENTVSVVIKKKQCQNRLDYLEPLVLSLLQNDLFKEN